jgi:Ca2+-binding EF-hand superfamily protein
MGSFRQATFEEKLDISFRVYDSEGNKMISKENLQEMLEVTPTANIRPK